MPYPGQSQAPVGVLLGSAGSGSGLPVWSTCLQPRSQVRQNRQGQRRGQMPNLTMTPPKGTYRCLGLRGGGGRDSWQVGCAGERPGPPEACGHRVGQELPALVPCPLCPGPSSRLGAEAGEGVQASLTAHRQRGGLAGRDVVGHVALPHEGADPQLLRGLLGPPQAGAGQERRRRHYVPFGWGTGRSALLRLPGPRPAPSALPPLPLLSGTGLFQVTTLTTHTGTSLLRHAQRGDRAQERVALAEDTVKDRARGRWSLNLSSGDPLDPHGLPPG